MPTNERHARVTASELPSLGELTKNEIRVLLFLRICRNHKTGRCDPSRATIGAGSGIKHRSHVTEAIAGLETKGWIVEDTAGFLFPNLEHAMPPTVPESGTNAADVVPESGAKTVVPESGTFPILEQVVPDSARNVPESGKRRNKGSNNKNNSLNKPMSRKRDGGTADDIDKVFDYYKTTFGKTDRFTLTPKRKKAIKKRLETKSVADLFDAINGCKVSPHHSGDNSTGTVYDDIELICRTDDHTERFIEIYERRQRFAGKRGGERFAACPDPNAETGDIDDRLFVPSPTMRPAPDLPPSIAAVWAKTKTALAKQFSPEVMRNWFEGIVFDGLDKTGRRLLLRAGQANADWVRIYYSDALDDCLAAGGLDGYKIAWEVDNGEVSADQLRAAL
jgi:hypothetical protein